jgi:hypothetical protein
MEFGDAWSKLVTAETEELSRFWNVADDGGVVETATPKLNNLTQLCLFYFFVLYISRSYVVDARTFSYIFSPGTKVVVMMMEPCLEIQAGM